MCYYTITLDQSDKAGHVRALMITDAKSKEEAVGRFLHTFGSEHHKHIDTVEGIRIENGFNELLTDVAKKTLVKIKTNNNPPSDFLYSNQMQIRYSE